MTVWTIGDLLHLTRAELCDLALCIESALPTLEEGTVERLHALVSLNNVRRVMVMRDLHF